MRTFAISLQVLPLSRICFRRCSSAAVHGVLVRLFFLPPLSSDRSAGIDTLAEPPLSATPMLVGGGLRSSCRVSVAGLREAGLFRGFGAGGGFVSSMVEGAAGRCDDGGGGGRGGGSRPADLGGEDTPELVLGRFEGGGVLCRVCQYQLGNWNRRQRCITHVQH